MAKIKKKYYMNRGKEGQEQAYDSPDKLMLKAYEYFAWCDEHPLNKSELMKSGDRKGDVIDVPIGRPYTLVGLCVYCGISEGSFKTLGAEDDFATVVKHICDIIRQEQIEGASLGIYNATIISRMQGLNDKQEQSANGKQMLTVNIASQKTKDEIEYLKNWLSDE
ncbi:terminase small subunit [Dysgonomonas sp. ZJ279]|uniref:terminase small subunit n=1 Tax=Dysgonomonas sp. ZJ279 TaxID=2709796 RepID=UPI0013ED2D08|nr:terminase small subunit [Dysgonomonas sp. ZJ279]